MQRPLKIDERLPLPPTINSYYGVDPHSRRRYIAKAGVTFRKQVAAMMIGKAVFASEMDLVISITWHMRGKGDIDNRVKPLLDALQEAGTIPNDAQVKEMHVYMGHKVVGGAVDIIITEKMKCLK